MRSIIKLYHKLRFHFDDKYGIQIHLPVADYRKLFDYNDHFGSKIISKTSRMAKYRLGRGNYGNFTAEIELWLLAHQPNRVEKYEFQDTIRPENRNHECIKFQMTYLHDPLAIRFATRADATLFKLTWL